MISIPLATPFALGRGMLHYSAMQYAVNNTPEHDHLKHDTADAVDVRFVIVRSALNQLLP